MSKLLRVILINTQHSPTRSEIASIERGVGERFFQDIPLEWAGWTVHDDTFNLNAQWLASEQYLDELRYRIEHSDLQGYRVCIYSVDDEDSEETLVY